MRQSIEFAHIWWLENTYIDEEVNFTLLCDDTICTATKPARRVFNHVKLLQGQIRLKECVL